jgi:ABC-2 type transport system ATP-binding protein
MQGVSKWYGQVIALNDVTVEVPSGVTGLLGPNGAGKSTFLKLATGLMRPRQGQVRLLGQDPWNNPGLIGRVGLAPEHDAFYEWMTGFEFLETLLRIGGFRRGEAARAAREAIATVGMDEAADRKIQTYSKGMRQRIKIGQALAHKPEVLLLDEPLTGTDPVGRRDLIRLIRELGGRGLNVLVSSHVLHEIESMTKNILLIAQGRIVAEGDIHQIRQLMDEHPHNVQLQVDDARRLASALLAFPDVVNVRFQGPNELLVETTDPDAFYGRMPQVLARSRLSLTSMWSPDDNLQAVFKYLVK